MHTIGGCVCLQRGADRIPSLGCLLGVRPREEHLRQLSALQKRKDIRNIVPLILRRDDGFDRDPREPGGLQKFTGSVRISQRERRVAPRGLVEVRDRDVLKGSHDRDHYAFLLP